MYRRFIKRFLDIVLSFIALVVFAVPMLIFALIIKLEDGSPVFFLQKRVGLHKKHFMIYKFRSMKNSTPHDTATHLLENPGSYMLKCGQWMRLYSIDELPQLINIFKGDMSIVGPRPALWNQFDLIEERDKYGANDVRPGLTGWAQIQGRDHLDVPEKAMKDGEYVKHLSFSFDLMCIMKTFGRVAKHQGVYEGAKKK
ncbi:MAG: sugar transferase [Synergistaceae bacterium]|nr:sugar transferase [Synergistaceae bacterium]